MMDREFARHLLRGPLLDQTPDWPLSFSARLCDLKSRFLVKDRVRNSYRAVARNGRVLLCSNLLPEVLGGRAVRVRFQTWHKVILPGEAARPYGLLFCVQAQEDPPADPLPVARLVPARDTQADLVLDVGGGLLLAFEPAAGRLPGLPVPVA